MPSVSSLIRAHQPGDAESLQALGLLLAATVDDTPPLPEDPAELVDAVDTQGAELAGTWQEVRAAHDHGDLTDAEYDYLAAAMEALTRKDTQ